MQQRAFGSEGANWPGTRQDVTEMSRPPMYEAMPITRPPAPGGYTTAPSAPPGGWQMQNTTSLLGLESLMHLDRIYIDQHLEELEIFTGFHGKNKYTMMDASRQPVFHLREESSAISRMCCGNARDFYIKAFDNSGQEVFRLERPLECFLHRIDVYASNRLIGTIQQMCSWFKTHLEVKDSQGTLLFQIEGPGCTCFSSTEYRVFTADKVQQIGVISREWPGLPRALFTKADVFGVSFPRDLDVYQKVLLIGSTILIDFIKHEDE